MSLVIESNAVEREYFDRQNRYGRAEVIEYLTDSGQGCMFGLIPVEASPTVH